MRIQETIGIGVEVLLLLIGASKVSPVSSSMPVRERLRQVYSLTTLIGWMGYFKDIHKIFIILLNRLADLLAFKLLKL